MNRTEEQSTHTQGDGQPKMKMKMKEKKKMMMKKRQATKYLPISFRMIRYVHSSKKVALLFAHLFSRIICGWEIT